MVKTRDILYQQMAIFSDGRESKTNLKGRLQSKDTTLLVLLSQMILRILFSLEDSGIIVISYHSILTFLF